MDSLIDRLQHQTDGLDTAGLDPAQHLGAVMQQGRRHRAVVTGLGAVGATVVLAGSALALPHVVELLEDPVQPTVAATPDEEEAPEALVTEEPSEPVEQPVVEAPAEEVEEEPLGAPDEVEVIDTVAPSLEVLEPADGEVVTSSKVTFAGTTEPGATVVVGEYEAEVDEDGRWSILLIASEGGNEVTFAATDAAGNTTTRTTSVTYNAPVAAKKTTTAPPGDSTLTAAQQSSRLEVAPYKNVYSGTAAPGAKVAVLSDYGSAHVYADEQGQWEVRVAFSPPAGEKTFPVTVKLYYQPEVRRTFELTTVAAEATLTAQQQSGVLDAAPHKNVYWGTAAPGAKVAVLSDYGSAYVYANEAGQWETYVDFDPPGGEKTFPVTVKLYYQPEVRTTFELTTIAEQVAAFTASQQLASVSASAPTNTYSGTGEPGHEVWIWTELHGQSGTVIGADGTWQVTMTYSDVAPGETFTVKAKDVTSGAKHLFEVAVTE